MTDQVWVEIGEGVSMAIDRVEAMSLDRDGFVRLYKRHVYPPPGLFARRAWKRDAEAWADKQIADRALGSQDAKQRRPEDDALDRLLATAEDVDDIATVRRAIEQQREESALAHRWLAREKEISGAAEDEVRRLNGYIDQYILDVERLAERLRGIEWIDRGEGYDECAYCAQSEASGHTEECPLAALLSASHVEGFPSVAPTFGTYDAPERLREKGTE